ncbi:MAG: tandem-95 repeat protein, partial [Cocleimonas sp.]|nr:tandem-95 repeat protein [Cocleimonas sp.]
MHKLLLITIVLFVVVACGDRQGASNKSLTVNNANDFSGVVQKGPFFKGSTVKIRQLLDNGHLTTHLIKIKTNDEQGHYRYTLPDHWPNKNQQPIVISATGSFLKEAIETIPSQQITLNALVDKPRNSNVNLLTHWIAFRAQVLMQSNHQTATQALTQANNELSQLTSIYHADRLDINQATHYRSDAAQLLLLSGALLEVSAKSQRSEQHIINDIALDFAKNGTLDQQGKAWFQKIQDIIRHAPHQRGQYYADTLRQQTQGDAPNAKQLPDEIKMAQKPQAIAPKDIFVAPKKEVIIDAGESHNHTTKAVNFSWFGINQVAKAQIKTNNRFKQTLRFTAPDKETTLLFALIVTNINQQTDGGLIRVIVKKPKLANRPPVAFATQHQLLEDSQAVKINLLARDQDNDELTYDLKTPLLLQHGVLEGTAPNLMYTPSKNSVGIDTFSFAVSDGQQTSKRVNVTLTIEAVNDRPIANNARLVTNENTFKDLTLSASDVEKDKLSFHIKIQPSKGRLDTSALPLIRYTPNKAVTGSDQFSFQVHDGTVFSKTAHVTITIKPVNDKPFAMSQSLTTQQDKAITITLKGTDPEKDTLSFNITQPRHGTLKGARNTWRYTPEKDFSGTDQFNFTVSDGKLSSDPATVKLTIQAVVKNKQPTAHSQNISTFMNQPLNIKLTGTDKDGDILSYALRSFPFDGKLSGTAPDLTYTPNRNYSGQDAFIFTVNDKKIESDLALINITVLKPKNTQPIAIASAPLTHIILTEGTIKTVKLDGSKSSDVEDKRNIDYQWQAPTGITPNSATAQRPSFKISKAGSYTFGLIVTDKGSPPLRSAISFVTIIIENNPPPKANAGGDQRVNEKTKVT